MVKLLALNTTVEQLPLDFMFCIPVGADVNPYPEFSTSKSTIAPLFVLVTLRTLSFPPPPTVVSKSPTIKPEHEDS